MGGIESHLSRIFRKRTYSTGTSKTHVGYRGPMSWVHARYALNREIIAFKNFQKYKYVPARHYSSVNLSLGFALQGLYGKLYSPLAMLSMSSQELLMQKENTISLNGKLDLVPLI